MTNEDEDRREDGNRAQATVRSRKNRLAEQLRRNLRQRKQQMRERRKHEPQDNRPDEPVFRNTRPEKES